MSTEDAAGTRSLDERKATILRAVVEEYIRTAQPVGSQHVARAASIRVSPATVRNEMAVLEREGFLEQPHTSAGRIPTEKGYRFFVDTIEAPGALGATQREQVSSFFAHTHGELERMLEQTSRLLSDLTHNAAVVSAQRPERATVRSVQLVGLSSRSAVVVSVLSNGAVEKHTLELSEEIDDVRLAAASARLAESLVGTPWGEPPTIPGTGDDVVDRLLGLVSGALTSDAGRESEIVYVGGASQMAAAFDAVDTVRDVLTILEQQFVVVSLMREVLDRGLTVAIGSETGLASLAECSVVVSPYEVEGEPAGTIGILGPTRMDYPQALAAVAIVSRRLGSRLSEG